MNKELQIYFEVASHIQTAFHTTPILYGSLGLGVALQQRISINDIDILVPRDLLEGRWDELVQVMKNLDFELKDEKEHAFEREIIISFAKDIILKDVGLARRDLQEEGNSLVPTPSQYLKIYKYCLHDGYRQTKHSDYEKIALIE